MVISGRVRDVGCSSPHAKRSYLLWGLVAMIAEQTPNGGLGGRPVLAVQRVSVQVTIHHGVKGYSCTVTRHVQVSLCSCGFEPKCLQLSFSLALLLIQLYHCFAGRWVMT